MSEMQILEAMLGPDHPEYLEAKHANDYLEYRIKTEVKPKTAAKSTTSN
jgi:hypothetical protein